MSEQPSPKYSCHQTSISTLQISQKDMDSGPSPATSPEDRNPGFPCLHRRHRAQHARGSPRDTAGHPQTPCLHIRHGGLGARYPLGWADSEPPLGAMEGPQRGRQPCWPSTAPGAVRPLQPSRLLSRAEGLREPGLGRRKVLLPGAAAARSRRGGATSPSPPPSSPSMLLQHKSQPEATARDQRESSALWTSGSNPARHGPCICGTESTYPRKERSRIPWEDPALAIKLT